MVHVDHLCSRLIVHSGLSIIRTRTRAYRAGLLVRVIFFLLIVLFLDLVPFERSAPDAKTLFVRGRGGRR